MVSNQLGYRLNIRLRTCPLAKSCPYFLNTKSPSVAVLQMDGITIWGILLVVTITNPNKERDHAPEEASTSTLRKITASSG